MSNQTIGEYLREQREARSITLRECARLTGYTPSYLSKCERGIEEPGERVLQQYARYLKLDTDVVLLQAGRVPSDITAILARKPNLVKKIRALNNS